MNIVVKQLAYGLDRIDKRKNNIADAIIAEAASALHIMAERIEDGFFTEAEIKRIYAEGAAIRTSAHHG